MYEKMLKYFNIRYMQNIQLYIEITNHPLKQSYPAKRATQRNKFLKSVFFEKLLHDSQLVEQVCLHHEE